MNKDVSEEVTGVWPYFGRKISPGADTFPHLGPDLRLKPIATILGLVFLPLCLTGEGPKGQVGVCRSTSLSWLCFAGICPFLHRSDLLKALHHGFFLQEALGEPVMPYTAGPQL